MNETQAAVLCTNWLVLLSCFVTPLTLQRNPMLCGSTEMFKKCMM